MDTSQIDQLSHILQGLISTGLGMRAAISSPSEK